MAYRIEYLSDTKDDIKALTAAQRSLVLSTIEEQLVHQPIVETRNRKPMQHNGLADWELRVRDLRVYYVVQEKPEQVVYIRAVGVKVRDRVFIAGKEIEP